MKNILALVAVGLLLSACETGPKIRANTAPNANLNSYKTYSFPAKLGTDRAHLIAGDAGVQKERVDRPSVLVRKRDRRLRSDLELVAGWLVEQQQLLAQAAIEPLVHVPQHLQRRRVVVRPPHGHRVDSVERRARHQAQEQAHAAV